MSYRGDQLFLHRNGVEMILELYEIINERKTKPKSGSYTNSLFEAGQDRILQKVGEEAIELVLAAAGQGNQRVIEESADLIYHLWVLLAHREIPLEAIEEELERRHS